MIKLYQAMKHGKMRTVEISHRCYNRLRALRYTVADYLRLFNYTNIRYIKSIEESPKVSKPDADKLV